MVFIHFGRKKWVRLILTEKTGFGRFRPKKVGLVDFDRTNWFQSILSEKCDSGSFWVIWGFLMSFLIWKLYFLWIFEVNYWFHGDSNPLQRENRTSCRCTTYTTTGFQKLSPVKPIYYWGGRPLGTKPVFCDFPPLGVWSAKTQTVKKLRIVW